VLASDDGLLLCGLGCAESHDFQEVLESIGVEQVIATLPEDAGQVAEEAFEDRLDVFLLLAVYQVEDGFGGAERI